jgi:hypothetical protein
MFEHAVVRPGDERGWPEWNRFVEGRLGGTVYHGSGWLRAVADGMGQDIHVHLALDGGEIGAGAVVRQGGAFGLSIARKPWATAYNGFVASPSAIGATAFLARCLLAQYKYVRLVQSPWSETPVPGPFDRGAVMQASPVLDVVSATAVYERFDRHARQRIRKAESAGVTVGQTADIGDFADLYRMTYERQGVSLSLDRQCLCDVAKCAMEAGIAKLFVARVPSGEAAAALLAGADTKRAYFMLAGSHPLFRKTDAVTLLWWEAMRHYAGTVSVIDLVGTATLGIERFKRSFSPRMQPFADTGVYSSMTARLVIEWGEKVRRIQERMNRR